MSMVMRGKFITIEGTEGVGKSTNIEFITQNLKQSGIDFIRTREPGGTQLAEELRDILLANRDEKFNSTAELLIIFAARAQHLNQVILPALAEGKWVVCDRFTDATYAYQGYGRGLSLDEIKYLEQHVQGTLRPDQVFLLDIDVEVGLERAAKRGALDRFEKEKLEFFERVRAGYKKRAAENPMGYSIIDANLPIDIVQQEILLCLKKLISTEECAD